MAKKNITDTTNCDQLPVEAKQANLDTTGIGQLIQTIRGQQVILDRDLAILYGVETKRLNEQVRRNIERFPERFRFQISKEEKNELVAICDRFKILKHSSSAPYAFTEQGISFDGQVFDAYSSYVIWCEKTHRFDR